MDFAWNPFSPWYGGVAADLMRRASLRVSPSDATSTASKALRVLPLPPRASTTSPTATIGPEQLRAAWRIASAAYERRVRPDGRRALVHAMQVRTEVIQAGIECRVVQLAALLHGVLEDASAVKATKVLEDIRDNAGSEVADIVQGVTPKSHPNDLLRNTAQISRMTCAALAVRQVTLADRLAGLRKPPRRWAATGRSEYASQTRALMIIAAGTDQLLELSLSKALTGPEWCSY